MKIEGIENISDLFCAFHDGELTNVVQLDKTIQCDVEIKYLAEQISPNFSKFHIVLENVDSLRFTTWPSNFEEKSRVLCVSDEIFKPDLDILEGNIVDSTVQVISNQADNDFDYCGGELYFSADYAVVSDESEKVYSLDDLKEISRKYWDEWEEAGKKRREAKSRTDDDKS